MPLTDVAIRNAKPAAKPLKMFDGGGLFLQVQPTGGKLWRLKYYVGGKEKLLAIGKYPDISLVSARKRRDKAREQVAEGIDPSAQKQADKRAERLAASNSFKAVAELWWAGWSATRSAKHADQVKRRLEADVYPAIGDMPISAITAQHLIEVSLKIEKRGANDIARRAYQMTGQVLRFAVARGYIARNPAADIRPGDALKPRVSTNYARLDAAEVPELLRKIDSYDGSIYTRMALQLIALTFVRTSELIEAEWTEFDLVKKQWRIPAARMKMGTPHVVPLSTQALAIIKTLKDIRRSSAMVFPGERDHDKPMSNNTILYALYRLGYRSRMTGHGFRGIASTVLHELEFRHDVIELQLAHQERDKVSSAYNFATYLPQRAAMMQQWADHLDELRGHGVYEQARVNSTVPADMAAAA